MFTVEIYAPGEIVSARHPLEATNLRDAKLEMYSWLALIGTAENATNYRLLNGDDILIDKSLAEPF
ncbi:hypothetical protein [Rhodopseudomonas sp. P2A-2r]|uniref:hypothetical protein n=1 Tax=unclassified Rhodopseudomonas TaxID=2638247 RepID=UPI00223416F7|nr:hypothetical protein [Rhodopseudomonas sp. P2A-2r]UZE51366.1 hypothetical protein ONR75_12590 [Rhodopseudomonas sp. P2A-2r]